MAKSFFSYHSTDRGIVEDIARRLQELGLDLWLDQMQGIDPSQNWVSQIEAGLQACGSYAAFWGPQGYGEFQKAELDFIKNRFVNDKAPCVVVRLPGCKKAPPKDLLSSANHVTFRYLGDEKGIDDIYRSLTGEDRETAEKRARVPKGVASVLATQAKNLRRDGQMALFVGATTDEPSVECMLQIRDDLLHALEPEEEQDAGPGRAEAEPAVERAEDAENAEGETPERVPGVDPGPEPGEAKPPNVCARLETMGFYFTVLRSDTELEQKVDTKLEDYSLSDSPTLERLAAYLRTVEENRRTERQQEEPGPQLVVTTRLDLMLERALLRAGLSFQRIVHHRSDRASNDDFLVLKGDERRKMIEESWADWNQVEPAEKKRLLDRLIVVQTRRLPSVSEAGEAPRARGAYGRGLGPVRPEDFLMGRALPVEPTDNEALNKLIRSVPKQPNVDKRELENLLFSPGVSVVLYKLAGSIELPSSCLLTSEHHLEFARNALKHKLIPNAVVSVIQPGTPVVFMGYSLLDADLRLLRNTVLADKDRKRELTVLVRPRPGVQPPGAEHPRPVFCEVERRLWVELVDDTAREMDLGVVDCEEEDFLEQLSYRVAAELTG